MVGADRVTIIHILALMQHLYLHPGGHTRNASPAWIIELSEHPNPYGRIASRPLSCRGFQSRTESNRQEEQAVADSINDEKNNEKTHWKALISYDNCINIW